jgi:hypothetical protein
MKRKVMQAAISPGSPPVGALDLGEKMIRAHVYARPADGALYVVVEAEIDNPDDKARPEGVVGRFVRGDRLEVFVRPRKGEKASDAIARVALEHGVSPGAVEIYVRPSDVLSP